MTSVELEKLYSTDQRCKLHFDVAVSITEVDYGSYVHTPRTACQSTLDLHACFQKHNAYTVGKSEMEDGGHELSFRYHFTQAFRS